MPTSPPGAADAAADELPDPDVLDDADEPPAADEPPPDDEQPAAASSTTTTVPVSQDRQPGLPRPLRAAAPANRKRL
jgi:hypothetical protein